jgi:hypothetical protein
MYSACVSSIFTSSGIASREELINPSDFKNWSEFDSIRCNSMPQSSIEEGLDQRFVTNMHHTIFILTKSTFSKHSVKERKDTNFQNPARTISKLSKNWSGE